MNSQKWMSQNFFIFFITWGIFLPYWTGWLVLAKGLSVAVASLIMGLATIIRGLSSMFAYPILSKFLSQEKSPRRDSSILARFTHIYPIFIHTSTICDNNGIQCDLSEFTRCD